MTGLANAVNHLLRSFPVDIASLTGSLSVGALLPGALPTATARGGTWLPEPAAAGAAAVDQPFLGLYLAGVLVVVLVTGLAVTWIQLNRRRDESARGASGRPAQPGPPGRLGAGRGRPGRLGLQRGLRRVPRPLGGAVRRLRHPGHGPAVGLVLHLSQRLDRRHPARADRSPGPADPRQRGRDPRPVGARPAPEPGDPARADRPRPGSRPPSPTPSTCAATSTAATASTTCAPC